MRTVLRGACFLVVFMLFLSLTVVLGQDDGQIVASGSRAVIEDVFLPAVSDAELEIRPQISGTANGIAAFCAGEAQIAGATRPLTLEEEELCQANGVTFNEYLLGYEIATFIVHPEVEFVSCLTTPDLSTIFAPSAAGRVNDWETTGLIESADVPFTVFLPNTQSATYALVDEIVDGFGLRNDAAVVDSVADEVAATPGSIGATTLASVEGRDDVRIVELNTTQVSACASPSAEAVSDRRYGAANPLLLYVNTTLSDNAALSEALEFMFSDGAEQIAEAGYTAPEAAALETNLQILAGELEEGRQFSSEVSTFSIPGNVIGAVRVEGSTNPVDYLNDLDSQFTSTYPSVNIVLETFGEASAAEAFCGGESDIDILALSEPLPDEVNAACEENDVQYLSFELGRQTVVLLGNTEDDFTECLTIDQLRTIWGSPSTDTITTWNQVDESFPEQEIFTFAPPSGTTDLADLFLAQPEGPGLPLRTDVTERNNDPLYRATAVSNASGTITFMDWADYQDVEEAEGVHLIAVNGNEGCVVPSEESIRSGEYPLSENSLLLVNVASLGRTEVQSVLWYIFTDENFNLIEDAGFIGITLAQLPEIRNELQDQFAEATVQIQTGESGAPGFDPLARPSGAATGSSQPEATPPVDESTPPVEDQ